MKRVLLTLLLGMTALPVLAQEVYKPMGAPADPKVEAHWNRFHDHAAATTLMKSLVAAHPELCRMTSLGDSYGGREMWVLTVTAVPEEKEMEHAAFYIDGGIHANELQGPDVVLYTAWFLCEMYERNTFITKLLQERVFYMIPMVSPDSRDAHMNEPNTPHSPRTGQRPIDDDRDGLVDEDGPNDLDGDKSITSMRIKDPNGRWKEDPKFPGLMRRCDPEEKGTYRMLGSEGVDDDGDGRVNEDGDGSYDPNRDWAWRWQPQYVQRGAHRYPFSILENRMVADFIAAHPNIAGAQSYHNAGGMILRGPGDGGSAYDRGDVRTFDVIGKKGERILPGYRYLVVHKDLYEVFGGELDWIYGMRGAITYTNELWTPFNYFRESGEGDGFFGGSEERYDFDKYLLFGEGIADWKEYNHPVYGKVEIGGTRKEWTRQPPSFLLEEECHRNMAFTLYHADQMPKVSVDAVTVKKLANGLTQVTAVVSNAKVTPSRLAVDVKNRIFSPDRVSLDGGTVLMGMVSDEPFFEDQKEQKRNPRVLRVATIPGMSARYCRWIVEGEGPFTVTLTSVKGGVSSRSGE
jgi:hypothetical protein